MRNLTLCALSNAVSEKDVENAYRAEFMHHTPHAVVSSPHKTDGYMEYDTPTPDAKPATVRLLLEAKWNRSLKLRQDSCGVICQLILYLKKFERKNIRMPNVLFVGDKDECFVLSTSVVQKFLSMQIDWSVAPSTGSPELLRALISDTGLVMPHVWNVDSEFSFGELLQTVACLAEGQVTPPTRATLTNVGAMFTYWVQNVFSDKKLSAVEQVDVFLRCLFHPADVNLHNTKRGVLTVPGYDQGVVVNGEAYKSFFSHFVQGYKPSEIEKFYSLKDRLITDDARRRQGAFYTPSLWVDEAHKMVDSVLGANWRQECIVWDPACGTGNLTRDYSFADLILSTAEQPDVQVIRDQKYNTGCGLFQYDFLNPNAESPFFEKQDQRSVIPPSVDKRLRAAAPLGKRLVFFMNPPYGTACNAGTKENDHKSGIADTLVNTEMEKQNLGASRQQLYAQFMFRCSEIAREYGFKQITVATFSVPTFMSSGSYSGFRKYWYPRFGYQTGMLFNAGHFADVSDRWGISFTVWSSGAETGLQKLQLKDEQQFQVVLTGTKTVYHSDDREASIWVREPIKGQKTFDAPQMSSGLTVNPQPKLKVPFGVAGLFYNVNLANCIYQSATNNLLLSGSFTAPQGFTVQPGESFRRSIALYAARKLVLETWDTQKDEYLAPTDTNTPDYQQWLDDCHVYAILHNSNNCTAMRDVQYKGKTHRIKNHFFWRTRAQSLQELDSESTRDIRQDCLNEPCQDNSDANPFGFTDLEPETFRTTGDSYIASLLADGTLKLSPDAQAVLDKLNHLYLISLPLRENYAAGKPELHLLSWDAGVYQLKHLWRDLFPTEWLELQSAFKALSDKLRPGVYEHGFLIK